jgi:hypothetical protein
MLNTLMVYAYLLCTLLLLTVQHICGYPSEIARLTVLGVEERLPSRNAAICGHQRSEPSTITTALSSGQQP